MSSFRTARRFLPALTVAALAAAPALAQQISNEPWSPGPTNRAQIAFSLKALNNDGNGGPGGGFTTIVCGGGSATAAANNTCIILNNSNGTVMTDQDSDGDQNATTTANSTTTTNIDEVSELLGLPE